MAQRLACSDIDTFPIKCITPSRIMTYMGRVEQSKINMQYKHFPPQATSHNGVLNDYLHTQTAFSPVFSVATASADSAPDDPSACDAA